jgi:hypothetical protein
MQSLFTCKPTIVATTALGALAVTFVRPHLVPAVALYVCSEVFDFASNVAELPCRLVRSIQTLPERMDPTCSECNEP